LETRPGQEKTAYNNKRLETVGTTLPENLGMWQNEIARLNILRNHRLGDKNVRKILIEIKGGWWEI
jgi:hypothetical protein